MIVGKCFELFKICEEGEFFGMGCLEKCEYKFELGVFNVIKEWVWGFNG